MGNNTAHPPQITDSEWKNFLPENLLNAGKSLIPFVGRVQWSFPLLKGSVTENGHKLTVELNLEDRSRPTARCTCGLTERHSLCKHAIAVYFAYFDKMLQAAQAIWNTHGVKESSKATGTMVDSKKVVQRKLKVTSAPMASSLRVAQKAAAAIKDRLYPENRAAIRTDAKFLGIDRAAQARANSTQTLANFRPDYAVPAPHAPSDEEYQKIRQKLARDKRRERKIESDLDFEGHEDTPNPNKSMWKKRSTWVRPITENEIIVDWVRDPRHYHDVTKTPERRIIFLNTEYRLKIDGDADWLMVIPPDVDSFNYEEVVDILKQSNFVFDPDSGRWFLDGEHAVLCFFSRGWQRLEEIAPARKSVKFSSILNSIKFSYKLNLNFALTPLRDGVEMNLSIETYGADTAELERALACSRPYVRIPELDRYVVVTQRVLDQINNIKLDLDLDVSGSSAATKWSRILQFVELPMCEALMRNLGILGDGNGYLPDYWRAITEPLREPKMLPQIRVPEPFNSQLRPYQLVGAQWMTFLHANRLGGLLADEMGLGKTVEAIAFLAADYNETLIAREEFAIWEKNSGNAKSVPEKSVPSIGGETSSSPIEASAASKGDETSPLQESVPTESVPANPVPAPQKIIVKTNKSIAAAVKRLNEQQSAAQQLLRERQQERIAERAYLIVAPAGLVENWRRELQRFAPQIPVYVHHGNDRDVLDLRAYKEGVVLTSYSTLSRDALFFMEREWHTIIADEAQQVKNRKSRNSQALRDLRAKTRFVLTGTPVENSIEDLRTLFDFLLPGYIADAQRNTHGMSLQEYLDRYERLSQRRAAPYILRRTKANVAPELPPRIEQLVWCEFDKNQAQLYKDWQDKTRKEFSALEAAGTDENVLRLTAFAQLMRLRQICTEPRLVDPAISENDSTKLRAFREIRDEAIEGGHRMLVFSQFTSVLAYLKKALEDDGIRYEYIDGSTKNRIEICDRFNNDPTIPVCLISLKAGGVGLNLTGADTVIHYDPWWNPAAEAQATDRAHRIGQTRVVNALKLIATGSIEERVLALQTRKRSLLAQVFQANQDLGLHITLADMKELLE